MSDELVVAARTLQELEPAARSFASAAGRSGPVREFATWITDEIRYRREPRKAQLLVAAAEKIRSTGLPTCGIDDRLLRAVLEEGAFEDDPSMRERWANLLANSVVSNEAPHVSFPTILSQVSPLEAQMLDAMHRTLAEEYDDRVQTAYRLEGFPVGFFSERIGLDLRAFPTAAGNLMRLQLAERVGFHPSPHIIDAHTQFQVSHSLALSYFGASFIAACSPPSESRVIFRLEIRD